MLKCKNQFSSSTCTPPSPLLLASRPWQFVAKMENCCSIIGCHVNLFLGQVTRILITCLGLASWPALLVSQSGHPVSPPRLAASELLTLIYHLGRNLFWGLGLLVFYSLKPISWRPHRRRRN